MRIDLNCDMGESFGAYTLGQDAAVLPLISSANIACGLHAGDPLVMAATVKQARDHGVAIGAHPGYPDLQGFGRREMRMPPDEVEQYVLYQIGALAGFARAAGVELTHVKPHGALYNQAAADPALAAAIARAVARFSRGLILVGLAGSTLAQAGLDAGLRAAHEGFPDRAYMPDGSLMPRRLPGAVLERVDEICGHAVTLARNGIRTANGSSVRVDTLCLHSDHPQAAQNARAVRAALQSAGVEIVPLAQVFEPRV